MRMNHYKKLALGLTFLAFTLPAGLAAQTADTTTTTTTTTTPAPAPVDPLAGITGVLHGVNLTGLVDVYYQYNANNPAGGTYTEPFTATNSQFQLNLLELQLDKPVDKTSPLGFRVAFGFGNAMTATTGGINGDGGTTSTQYLKEGYLSYMAPIGKGLQFDFGKFVTPAGAEVIETNQNWNYTRSLLFYYAIPYYHFGARAKYNFNDKWSITGIAGNGWNNVLSSNTGKTGGFSLNWNATKKITLTENYLTGPRAFFGSNDNGSWNNLSDTVLAYNPTPKLSLVANFDYDHQGVDNTLAGETGFTSGGADYTGIAGYLKYAFNAKTAAAVRYEYLNDHDGLAFFAGGSSPVVHNHPQEVTFTAERKFAGHLISRLEYRYDSSNQNIFERGGGKGPDSFVSGQNTVDVGMIFVLEPAQ